MQLHRPTWEAFFRDVYGWEWREVVEDDARNIEAAVVVWQRAGETWGPWDCKPR